MGFLHQKMGNSGYPVGLIMVDTEEKGFCWKLLIGVAFLMVILKVVNCTRRLGEACMIKMRINKACYILAKFFRKNQVWSHVSNLVPKCPFRMYLPFLYFC